VPVRCLFLSHVQNPIGGGMVCRVGVPSDGDQQNRLMTSTRTDWWRPPIPSDDVHQGMACGKACTGL